MPNDLEDFLRRAAERRQQKAAGQAQPPAPPAGRPPSQYSDSRTERVTRPVESGEPILTGDIIERGAANPIAEQLERVEAAKQAATEALEAAQAKARRTHPKAVKKRPAGNIQSSGNPGRDLIKLLQQPGGVQLAILAREILDRPTHRW